MFTTIILKYFKSGHNLGTVIYFSYGAEGILFILFGVGAAVFFIIRNKAELPDPKEMRETRSNESRESDDLGSSLSDSLNQLSSNENKTKREAKKRTEFIQKIIKL